MPINLPFYLAEWYYTRIQAHRVIRSRIDYLNIQNLKSRWKEKTHYAQKNMGMKNIFSGNLNYSFFERS